MSIDYKIETEIIKHNYFIEKENKERISALFNENYRTYYILTNKLGFYPESSYAYEKGHTDDILYKKSA